MAKEFGICGEVLSGGGQLITKEPLGRVVISSGVTGTIETITPPSGQRVIIDSLTATTLIESNISITVGGVDIITNKTLDANGTNVLGDFSIGPTTNAAGGLKVGNYESIIGDIDEVILIKKSGGNTVNDITYFAKYTD